MRLFAAITLAIWTCVLVGCERAETTPSRTDGPRIVVLSPAIAVMLADLGLEDRVVGRHAWDIVLDASIPVCGEQGAINYEALIRARPTHVLTEWGSRDLPTRLTSLVAANGWIGHDFRLLTLQDTVAAMVTIESMFPAAVRGDRAERLFELLAEPQPPVLWPGRVLLVMDTSPVAALGPGSAHHELLERVGGVPALDEGSPYMRMHAEDVVRLAPDAIVLIRGGEPDADAGEPSDRFAALEGLDIPAVREGRLATIEHPLGLIPSTGLAEIAGELERVLRAWAE